MAAIAEMPDAEGLTTFFKSVGYPEKNAKMASETEKLFKFDINVIMGAFTSFGCFIITFMREMLLYFSFDNHYFYWKK